MPNTAQRTQGSQAEASQDHKMVERIKIIGLTDASTFGRACLHRIVQPDRVHTVITDASISPDYRIELDGLGIELLLAE